MSELENANSPVEEKRRFNMDDWWEDRSLAQKILWGIGFGVVGIGLCFLFGLVVMLLWNWLIPDIFGLKPLDYWQAWGMFILCTILFKGFGSNAGGSSGKSDRKRKKQLRQYIRESQDSSTKNATEDPQ